MPYVRRTVSRPRPRISRVVRRRPVRRVPFQVRRSVRRSVVRRRRR